MTQSRRQATSPRGKERLLTLSFIIIGLIMVTFFGFRTIRSFLQIQFTGLEPGVTDVELIRGWMTIPYLATAYGVPEEYLFKRIGVPRQGNQKKALRRLNFDYFEGEPEAILKAVQEAIKQYQAEHPPPTGAVHD